VKTFQKSAISKKRAGTYDVVLVLETGNTSDIGRLVLTQIHGTSGLKGTMTLMAVT
jgi:hypothetical protein